MIIIAAGVLETERLLFYVPSILPFYTIRNKKMTANIE